MRQITFILLCCCTWWTAAAWANPVNNVSVNERPDFIVADIVGIHGNGSSTWQPIFTCSGASTPMSNGQVLYLPQAAPGITKRQGFIINFASGTQPNERGQLVAWLDCRGGITLSNIRTTNGIVYTAIPPGANVNELVFTIPDTDFRFRIYEIPNTVTPALYFEMTDCNANYCKEWIWDCDPRVTTGCNIEVLKECKQSDSGAWSMTMTLFYNGLKINNTNDPNCCVTWEYVNGIPSIPCPRPNGLPNINYTPMSLAEGRRYKVTITCGENCTYSETGTVGCNPIIPKSGESGSRSNDLNEHYASAVDASKLVSIYPNPADNQLAIRIHPEDIQSASYQLLLYDALGRQVLIHPLADESRWQILDISSFTPGVYTWRLINSNGERPLQTGKLLVHH